MGLGRDHYSGIPGAMTEEATKTKARIHVYANSTTGSDSNTGFSASDAKLTVQAAVDALPDNISHKAAVHLDGTFAGHTVVTKHCSEDLFIDGGTGVTELLTSTTADTSSILTIGLSTASWTTDEYAGKHVEILDGPAIGEIRMIQKNTGTLLTVVKAFSTDPGNAAFRVTQPSTTLTGFTSLSCTGFGAIILQRLRIGGQPWSGVACYSPQCAFSHVVNDSSYWAAFFSNILSVSISFNDVLVDTEADFTTNTLSKCGVSKLGTAQVSLQNTHYVEFWGAYMKNIYIAGSAAGVNIWDGCRFSDLTLQNSPVVHTIANSRAGSANATIMFSDSSGAGLTLLNSDAWIQSGAVDVSNNGTHGIVLEKSKLILQGALTGSNNTTAGVYAHSGSIMHIKDGTPPVITGSAAGNFSTDGSTNAGTWSGVDGGTPVFDNNELTLIKEV